MFTFHRETMAAYLAGEPRLVHSVSGATPTGLSLEIQRVRGRSGGSPGFALVVAFVQQCEQASGIGTIIAEIVACSVAPPLAWSGPLGVWVELELPSRPDASTLQKTTGATS